MAVDGPLESRAYERNEDMEAPGTGEHGEDPDDETYQPGNFTHPVLPGVSHILTR